MLLETQYNFLEEGGLTVGGGIELDQILKGWVLINESKKGGFEDGASNESESEKIC